MDYFLGNPACPHPGEGEIIRKLHWATDDVVFLPDHFTKQESLKSQATTAAREEDTLTSTSYLGDIISNTVISSQNIRGHRGNASEFLQNVVEQYGPYKEDSDRKSVV